MPQIVIRRSSEFAIFYGDVRLRSSNVPREFVKDRLRSSPSCYSVPLLMPTPKLPTARS